MYRGIQTGIVFILLLWGMLACTPDSNPETPPDGDDHTDGDGDATTDGDDPADGDESDCPPDQHWDDTAQKCLPGKACSAGMRWDAERGMCVPNTPDGDTDDEADGDSDEEDGPPDRFSCDRLELTARPFETAESSPSLYAVASDVSIPTRRGVWTLSEHWTGCENYLFIQDVPRQASGWDEPLFSRDLIELLDRLPRNTHVFFISVHDDPERRDASFAALEDQYTPFREQISAADLAHWYHHLHFVTAPADKLPAWLGEVFRTPRWGVAIDRFQRIRYIGSYADPTRYTAPKEWFAPNLAMAANEAIYYNFEAEREEALASTEALSLTVFSGSAISDPGWAGERAYADVAFPDAEAMQGFDRMELDLYLGCQGEGEYGTCPPWDYIVHLYLCDEDNPTQCNTELGRWITTYHREGRWVHDISPLLPLLATGGTRRLAFYTQQIYEVTLVIRLSDTGGRLRPIAATPLFTGGGFHAEYNDAYAPLDVPIPPQAEAVALATVITGHGMATPGNCAEFCNTTHHFQVNEAETVISFPQAGTERDCQNQVASGTVPNQYGTWWYGRSGWCPGKEVRMETHDVTNAVTPGENATVSYAGYYRGAPYSGEGANIVLTSWLVVYAPREK